MTKERGQGLALRIASRRIAIPIREIEISRKVLRSRKKHGRTLMRGMGTGSGQSLQLKLRAGLAHEKVEALVQVVSLALEQLEGRPGCYLTASQSARSSRISNKSLVQGMYQERSLSYILTFSHYIY